MAHRFAKVLEEDFHNINVIIINLEDYITDGQ